MTTWYKQVVKSEFRCWIDKRCQQACPQHSANPLFAQASNSQVLVTDIDPFRTLCIPPRRAWKVATVPDATHEGRTNIETSLGQKWDKPWQTEKPKKPMISDDSRWSKPCRTCAWTCSGRSLCASEHARGAKIKSIKSMILSNAFWHDSIVSCFGDVSPCLGIMFVLSLSGSTDHISPHQCL